MGGASQERQRAYMKVEWMKGRLFPPRMRPKHLDNFKCVHVQNPSWCNDISYKDTSYNDTSHYYEDPRQGLVMAKPR